MRNDAPMQGDGVDCGLINERSNELHAKRSRRRKRKDDNTADGREDQPSWATSFITNKHHQIAKTQKKKENIDQEKRQRYQKKKIGQQNHKNIKPQEKGEN